MGGLERALAVPVGGPDWLGRVRPALEELTEDFDEHIEVTEGPGGLHQAIMDGDLRLANAVIRLAEEHALIRSEIAALATAAQTWDVGEDQTGVDADRARLLRERANALLGQLVRHRQRGADLIYDAYETDIGGET